MMSGIFNHVWQSTVFAAAAALLSIALRHDRPRLRYGLWFVASVKFLVPFAALAAVGSLLEWRQAPAPIASVMTSTAIREFNAPFAERSPEGQDWPSRGGGRRRVLAPHRSHADFKCLLEPTSSSERAG